MAINTQKYAAPSHESGTLRLQSDGCTSKDSILMDQLASESLEIAGACINVFRLLGIHEQGKLIDLVGSGNPLASSTDSGYVLLDAFTDNDIVWSSGESGSSVLSSFIGYNFGTKKTSFGTERYAQPQPVFNHITRVEIQQGPNSANRITQARIERSDDGGLSWTRADVVNIPDTSELEIIPIRASAPSQIWRLVPLAFNGSDNDHWEVTRLRMMEYQETSLANIQDEFFLENRDRDYNDVPLAIRGRYDFIDSSTEFARFGIDMPEKYVFTVSFSKMVETLGRPIVIGDIIELPSEAQYDANLNPIKKFLEVDDAGWSAEGYTPGWKPLLYKFDAGPLVASQETRDIVDYKKDYVDASDDDFLTNQMSIATDIFGSSENIQKEAEDSAPVDGIDVSELATKSVENPDIPNIYDSSSVYIEDGIPPNGLPYTEAINFPDTPNDGDYHRLVYPESSNIPVKLFRYNSVKNRWIFKESDMRRTRSSFKPAVDDILNSPTRVDLG